MGSVKTNIGHLEAAAGIAGLIKVVLALQHREIVPHLHLTKPNPYIPWEHLPLNVPTRRTAWTPRRGRRIAGVSSFGFSGTNAHVVLEEAPVEEAKDEHQVRPQHVLVLSAKNESALKELTDRYDGYLKDSSSRLADICFTAAAGRSHFDHRVAIVAASTDQCREKMATAAPCTDAPRTDAPRTERHKIAFLFTGQGSQYVGMGQALYKTQPTFRRALNRCDEILQGTLPRPLLSVLYPDDAKAGHLNQTAYTQPALFAIEYALCELWRSWGIEPTAVLGHSVGEFAAACAAGVFSLEDGLNLIAARGRIMQNLPAGGSMFAISADEDRTRSAIEGYEDEVSIAAINGPTQTVISGASAAVQTIIDQLKLEGVGCAQLTVSHAFHSPLMDPVLEEFEQVCRHTTFSHPDRNIVNNVLGRVDTAQIATPNYWLDQIRRPVRFVDGMRELVELGVDIFLEIGPKPILTALGRRCVQHGSQLWLSSLCPGQDDWSQMLQSVADLYLHGTDIDWVGFDRDYPRRKLPLPSYPFQRRRYWFADSASATTAPADVQQTASAESAAAESAAAEPASAESAAAASVAVAASAAASMDQAFYDVQWQPKSLLSHPPVRRAAEYIPEPARIAQDIQPDVDRVRAQFELDRYADLDNELSRLSIAYVREAFQRLGWQPRAGDHVDWASFVQRFGIVDLQRALCGRMLEMMAEEGWLIGGDGSWKVSQALPPLTPAAQIASSLIDRVPECSGEISLLVQCGKNLADVLSGDVDPLQILFPDGSSHLVESLYSASPFARSLNTLVEESIARAVQDRPRHRPLKILEIGAGTGGTTAQVLGRLPHDRTEYVFTDVSEVFTRTAQKKFREFPFVRYGVLDIERDPTQQGYAPQQFDLILAANVLHATRDLRQSLEHVHQLLTPEGMLVLLEGTRPQRWLDLIFGLTDGWWRFDDVELRPKYPLISAVQWTDVLRQTGFKAAIALPGPLCCADPLRRDGPLRRDSADVDSPQSVVIAQRDADREVSRPAPSLRSASKDTWLIFADRVGVGERLAALLDPLGVPCILLFRASDYRQLDAGRFAVNPDNAGDLQQVVKVLRSGNQTVGRVIHLWSLDAASSHDLSIEALNEAAVFGCGSALQIVQALGRAGWSSQARIWFVTRGAQAVDDEDLLSGIAQSPLWGLGRVVSEELPGAWGALIDLDPEATVEQSAELLLAEIEIADDEDQVALRKDQRFAARLVPRAPETVTAHSLTCRRDASYLVSGGLGELGLRVAEWLVQQGARSLILFGRSPFLHRSQWDDVAKQDPRRAAQIGSIRRLEALGARVRIASVDTADEIGLTSLFDQLEAEGMPPIRGVVHAAGVATANALLELSAQELSDVLRPKVAGAWLLHRLLAGARLDFFINFSSGAALLGSPLLGSYAAANAFLDALAHHRRAQGMPVLSVNWGFWSEIGMAARSQREIGRGFAPQGMASFSPEQGLGALAQLLKTGATQTAVIPIDWGEWGRCHPRAVHAPLLRNVVQTETEMGFDASVEVVEADADREAILAAPSTERKTMVQQLLGRQIARVLRIPAAELDRNQPLNYLGIDSLMAVELRNHVQAHLGVVVPVAQLLENASTAQLAESIVNQLADADADFSIGAASDGLRAQNRQMSEAESAREALSRLDGMSDEEVDAMLNKMAQHDS
ncbi:MAG TPA: type I polyketide synthase [Pirellulales bacterium]|nr:type I polyketide synthase [Pirellulales bacterium]